MFFLFTLTNDFHICIDEDDPMKAAALGAVLIFLPGIQEIRSLFDYLIAQVSPRFYSAPTLFHYLLTPL